MNESVLHQQLTRTISETHFDDLGKKYRGKVRDTYDLGEVLVLITTDRISAFDHILRQAIPFKGQVLNQVAAFFFEHTADLVPNAVIAVPDANITVAVKCRTVPIEFVVRGYLAGHAWREYREGKRTLCGQTLPEGLRQNSRLPRPILTPSTKAAEGHDLDISRQEVLAQGILDADTYDRLETMALSLFERGTSMAASRGLILVDTKYEFGRKPDGEFVVIDEVHTPDSSRYFYADTYESLLEADRPQRQLSKEFLREWLMDRNFQGRDGQVMPDLPDDFRMDVSRRYIELYEAVSGKTFVPETSADPLNRMEQALEPYRK